MGRVLARFGIVERQLSAVERLGLRYRESVMPHPKVHPAVLEAAEKTILLDEREWRLEQESARAREHKKREEAAKGAIRVRTDAAAAWALAKELSRLGQGRGIGIGMGVVSLQAGNNTSIEGAGSSVASSSSALLIPNAAQVPLSFAQLASGVF